jgi:lysophospholipase L1-like esterase
VIFLGDSQTWGFGLGEDETIAAQFANQLNLDPRFENTESMNFGVSGYGPGQSYLKYLLSARRYRPDAIVFTYFHQNDLTEVVRDKEWGVGKPRFYMQDDTLCLGNVPPPVSSGWPDHRLTELISSGLSEESKGDLWILGMRFNSKALAFFQSRSIKPSLVEKSNWLSLQFKSNAVIQQHLDCPQAPSKLGAAKDDPATLLMSVLKQLKQLAEKDGAYFLILSIPLTKDYDEEAPSDSYRSILNQFEDAGVSFLDAYAIGKRNSVNTADYFLREHDPHLSARGSQLVAAELVKTLSEKLAR